MTDIELDYIRDRLAGGYLVSVTAGIFSGTSPVKDVGRLLNEVDMLRARLKELS